MIKYEDLRCRYCPSCKYCRGKVMKGSSECDKRRGIKSKKKSKRYNYIRSVLNR